MGTPRVSRDTSPTNPRTLYITEVDWVSQSQSGNYSTLSIYVRCINKGTTGAFSNYQGSHVGQVDGVGSQSHSGTMPAGVPTDGQRWYDGPSSYNVGHDANGNLSALTVRQIISGWYSFNDTGSLPAPPRIPKPPTAPGKPVASEILPTSVRLTWTASSDNKGSAIDGYKIRRWDTADGSGPYTDTPMANNLSRVVTGLIPGKAYTFAILAHNNSYGQWSTPSQQTTVTTLAPAHVKVGGSYVYAIPWIKVAGQYKVHLPWIKVDGQYKQPT